MTLQEFKDLSGQTDEHLAEQIGVDRSYLVKLRNGTATPSIAVLGRIRAVTKGAVTGEEWIVASASEEPAT